MIQDHLLAFSPRFSFFKEDTKFFITVFLAFQYYSFEDKQKPLIHNELCNCVSLLWLPSGSIHVVSISLNTSLLSFESLEISMVWFGAILWICMKVLNSNIFFLCLFRSFGGEYCILGLLVVIARVQMDGRWVIAVYLFIIQIYIFCFPPPIVFNDQKNISFFFIQNSAQKNTSFYKSKLWPGKYSFYYSKLCPLI